MLQYTRSSIPSFYYFIWLPWNGLEKSKILKMMWVLECCCSMTTHLHIVRTGIRVLCMPVYYLYLILNQARVRECRGWPENSELVSTMGFDSRLWTKFRPKLINESPCIPRLPKYAWLHFEICGWEDGDSLSNTMDVSPYQNRLPSYRWLPKCPPLSVLRRRAPPPAPPATSSPTKRPLETHASDR